MNIIETSKRVKHEVEILPVEDYENLGKDRYFFDWGMEHQYEVYTLQIIGSTDILGLLSIEKITSEWRVHIRLLTVARENKGKNKRYGRIAGNLIAHAAKIAVREFGELACVSLRPKSKVARHYIDKYNMRSTGLTLNIEVPEILDLITNYDKQGK